MSKAYNEYEVGYCRPPVATQFKSGKSGNPKGRPRGSHNLQTILSDELQSRVSVVINGRPVKPTKAELAVRQQVDKAAKGDLRSFSALMKLNAQAATPPDTAEGNMAPAEKTELTGDQFSEILASIVRDHQPEDGQ
ncbi:DUF5681 domain-containing protein [Brevundimonas sp.]|jgi:hypothetical protein|uniref:DUF5681 domain-containing protein n=1 Tax=Brevundimonas sp. TaxID=1871086 RepID=UPI003782E5DB